jgi:hypothetical protein
MVFSHLYRLFFRVFLGSAGNENPPQPAQGYYIPEIPAHRSQLLTEFHFARIIAAVDIQVGPRTIRYLLNTHRAPETLD